MESSKLQKDIDTFNQENSVYLSYEKRSLINKTCTISNKCKCNYYYTLIYSPSTISYSDQNQHVWKRSDSVYGHCI